MLGPCEGAVLQGAFRVFHAGFDCFPGSDEEKWAEAFLGDWVGLFSWELLVGVCLFLVFVEIVDGLVEREVHD